MVTEISSYEQFTKIREGTAMLAYFSAETCSACYALKPKVEQMVKSSFPQMEMGFVESDKWPEIAAQHRVFTVPTVLVFFEGREYVRKSRAFSVEELRQEIERIYSMLF